MLGNWVYEPLLRSLIGLIPWDARVIDIGCGPGHYVGAMQSIGWRNVRGIDGTPDIDEVSNGMAMLQDLTMPVIPHLIDCAQWGLCIEVGEHIPPSCEIQFLDNLDSLASDGLVITWSTMAGYGHINCRSEGYVAQQMAEHGWKVDDVESRRIKDRLGRRFKSWAMVLRRDRSDKWTDL